MLEAFLRQEPTCFRDASLACEFPSVERNEFVGHVNPRPAWQFLTFSFPARSMLVRFHLRSRLDLHEITQSDSVVRMLYHVQDVSTAALTDCTARQWKSMFESESALRKWLTAMHACFISEAPGMPKRHRVQRSRECRRFQRVDHLSSSETKLCSDARFMTASRSVSSSFFETCETRVHAMTIWVAAPPFLHQLDSPLNTALVRWPPDGVQVRLEVLVGQVLETAEAPRRCPGRVVMV